MDRLCIITLFMVTLLATACSTDDIVPAAPVAEGVLAIEASVEGFKDPTSTRTVDINYDTQFVSGDTIGIMALRDGKVMSEVNNIKAIFDGTRWTADDVIVHYTDATYIAYAPYKSTLKTDSIFTPDDVAARFASSVKDTGQVTVKDYRKQDVLVCKSGTISGSKLSFNFSHAFGMVELILPCKMYHLTSSDGLSTTLNDYVVPLAKHLAFTGKKHLCQVSTNRFRSIVRSDRAIDIKGTFEQDSKKRTYSYHLDKNIIQPGECRRIIVDSYSEEDFAYEQGDFFLSDGSLVHRNDGLTPDELEKCIGVVYYMDGDESRFGTEELNALGTPHGYVLSLKNAGQTYWGNNNNLSAITDVTTIDECRSDVNGLHNTLQMMADYTSGSSCYATIKQYNEDVPTPSFCTEWFLPAMGQWFDLMTKLGGVDFDGVSYTSAWQDNTTFTADITTSNAAIVESINSRLSAVGTDNYDAIVYGHYNGTEYYFSSSEFTEHHVRDVGFVSSWMSGSSYYTKIYFTYCRKGDEKRYVRTIFAF